MLLHAAHASPPDLQACQVERLQLGEAVQAGQPGVADLAPARQGGGQERQALDACLWPPGALPVDKSVSPPHPHACSSQSTEPLPPMPTPVLPLTAPTVPTARPVTHPPACGPG